MTARERKEAEEEKRAEKAFGRKQNLKSKTMPNYPASAEREFRRVLKKYLGIIVVALLAYLKTFKKPPQGGLMPLPTGTNNPDIAEIGAAAVSRVAPASVVKTIQTGLKEFGIEKAVNRTTLAVLAVNIKDLDRAATKTLGVGMKIPVAYFNKNVKEWDDRTLTAINAYVDDINSRIVQASTESEIKAVLRLLENGPKKMSRFAVTGLNGDVSGLIQRMVGCDRYVWATSRDDRVRECHAELDGKVIKWSDPPEMWYRSGGRKVYTGRHCHPGQDYNCRCVAITVFDKKSVLKILKSRDGLLEQ